jgi:pimeloyl-ACP methyl ester carboxylesterase
MIKVIFCLLLTAILFVVNLSAQQNKAIGTWEGILTVNKTDLRLVFHIKEENASLQAYLDSPDQLQYGLKMDTIIVDDLGFNMKLKIASAEYTASYTENKEEADGRWVQLGTSYPLKIKKNAAYKPRVFRQEPVSPFPYKVEEVVYENLKAKTIIGGSLTIPEGENKKYPAVLLISGSGSQDRDENIAGHKPFLLIADHLSRRGFAVLRVDDRGVGASSGNPQISTTADFVTDVKASISFLKKHPEVDPNKIFLVGHSEGGLIAIMTAAELKKTLAGIVLLAAPGVPMHELLLRQSADIIRQRGMEEEYIKAADDFNRIFYNILLTDKKNKLTVSSLCQKMLPHLKALPAATKEALEMSESGLMSQCYTFMMPWYRYFVKIDPRAYLKKVKCPVLALNGSMDIQVAAGPNLEAIRKTLASAGNKDLTCTEIQELNHLFQHCKSCSVAEYGELEETFAVEQLKAIENWLKGRIN